MSVQLRELLMSNLSELRYEPTAKRVRASLGGEIVADTTRALLVWEPRRVVPTYAVPLADLRAEVVAQDDPPALPDVSHRPVLDPSVPFVVHTAHGQRVAVRAGAAEAEGFRPADPDLDHLVVLDFGGFDWLEEDERIVSHPHDPYARIDVLRSSRHVRIELEGHLLAETRRSHLLFETGLPERYYLPREDVVVELRPSATSTYCAYKGKASYWSPKVGEAFVPDLVWAYDAPLHDAEQVRDLVCFLDERLDLVIDGQPRPRPVTPWS